MSPEPISISSTAGKAAGLIIKPLFAAVRKEMAKRGAGDPSKSNPASIDAELDAAIEVLLGESDTGFGQLKVWLKAAISSPPEILTDEDGRAWLARADIQAVLKQATIALIANQSLDAYLDEAKRLYGDTAGGTEWYGEPLFAHAVSFLALSITADIDTGTKVILETQNVHAEKNSAENAVVLERIDLLTDMVGAQGMLGQLPVEAMDSYLLVEVQRRGRLRSIDKPGKLVEVLKLGEQVLNGNLKAASAAAKVELFRFVAAEHARAGDTGNAATWLQRAVNAGADNVATDEARIAIQRDDSDAAITLLDGLTDRLASSLRMDALRKSKGEAEAIAYFEEFGKAGDLTGHALPALARSYFEVGRGAEGEQLLDNASVEQIFENPLLLFQRARARLALMASSNAAELFNQSTVLPSPNVLRNDGEGRRLRRQAVEDLTALEMILTELDETDFLGIVEPLKLYLQLLSDEERAAEVARAALQAKLVDPEEALTFAGLAQIFKVPFDSGALRTQLAQTRRLRAWSDLELHTAFQLQIGERNPAALVDFIDDNRERLETLLPEMSVGVEIEALVHLGKADQAKRRLDEAADRLPQEDRALLSDLVADKGEPPLAKHLARFEATGDERDLYLLVQAMVEAKDPRSGDYAARLWRIRHRTEDALLAANSYAFFAQDDELGRLLEEFGADLEADPALQAHRAWLLYRRGDMAGARQLLMVLKPANPEDDGLRQLEINIALETGEWHRLSELIQADLDQAEMRSPHQLLQAAAFAHFASHPQTMTLIRAAVSKAPEDPSVLMNAWDLAMRQGEDNNADASEWMARAIKLSGDGGMFRKANLEDVLALREQNFEKAKEIDNLIMSGQVTVGMATKPLGTNITELMLDRIWQNAELTDPRARLFLPFYAGNRNVLNLAGIDSIALDLPSILLLQMTGLLEQVFGAFPKVVLPAGTLATLFEHMRHAERGQPSRVKRVALVEHLIEARRISVLQQVDPSKDEVDLLWAAAEEQDGVIIHAPPLYEPGTLLEKVRDPTPMVARLASPLALAEELQSKAGNNGESGLAGSDDFHRFQLFTERWPNEPTELLGRPLMIDGTALQGLADADLLEPLLDTGARVFVTPDVRAICARERDEDEARKRVFARIEALRGVLSNALLQGRAQIGPAPSRKSKDDDEFSFDPLMALLDNPGDIQAIVSDERVVNKYLQATDSAKVTRPVATSLDVIDALLARKAIAGHAHEQARTRLRASGVGLIPLRSEEFVAAARRSDWTLGPGPELKAIRDSILLPLFRRGVQLPEERDWVTLILFALSHAVRDVFRKLGSVEDARKAADFAVACLPDIRAYVGGDSPPELQRWASEILVAFHGLALNAPDMPNERLKPFHEWYEQSLYPLLSGRDRDLLPAVKAQLKQFVVDDYGDRLDLKIGEFVPSREDMALFMFRRIPKPLANALLQDDEVRAALGGDWAVPLTVADHKVTRKDLFEFLRASYTSSPCPLPDTDGKLIAETAERLDDGTLRVAVGSHHVRFESSGLFSGDAEIRLKAVRELLAHRTLSIEREKAWLERATAGALTDDEFFEVTQAVQQTPQGFFDDMLEELAGENFAIVDLVPRWEEYFSNLVPGLYASSPAKQFKAFRAGEKSRVSQVDAVIAAGPLMVSPEVDAAQLVKNLSRLDQVRCGEGLIAAGDPFSLLAAFQIICAGLKNAKLRALGDRLIELAWKEPGSLEGRTTDFYSGVIATSAAVLERGDLQGWPLHRRRLAIFAHAGHIARVLLQFEVQRDELLQRTLDALGPYYQLGGALDERLSVGWEPGLLNRDAVKAYLLRRFAETLDKVEEANRPKSWTTLIEERAADFASAGEKLLLSLVGPVDEFTSQPPDRPAMSDSEYAEFLNVLGNTEAIPATNIAYVYPMMATLPEGADVEQLEALLTAKLDALKDEHLDQAVQIVLLLAWRWRLPQLARRVFDRFAKTSGKATIVLNWAIMASAAHDAAADQLATLEELAWGVALSAPAAFEPGPLLRSISAVANAAPDLAGALAKAKLAAALAI